MTSNWAKLFGASRTVDVHRRLGPFDLIAGAELARIWRSTSTVPIQPTESPVSKNIECACHGSVPWEAHMCCEGCGFIFDGTAQDAPDICRCGARLWPKGANDDEFKGRAICPKCYADKAAQQVPLT